MAGRTRNPAAGEENGVADEARRPRGPDDLGARAPASRRRGIKPHTAPVENAMRAISWERADIDEPNAGTRERKRTADDPTPRPGGPARTRIDGAVMPADVLQRFVQAGNKYFFPDGARAFTDRGRKLTTPSENTEVIRTLVTIAQARGWQEVAVHGTERFRKEAWSAARLAGLEVRGYEPTEFEHARLIRRLAKRVEGGEERGPPAQPAASKQQGRTHKGRRERAEPATQRLRRDELITGRLIDHGPAKYRHDPAEAPSYFVRIETSAGEREVWGVDLERACRESLTQPKSGDVIALRAIGREPVTVKTRLRGAGGEVEQKDKSAHRNRWIVEQREFFTKRAQAARTVRDEQIDPRDAVQRYPELAGTYLQLRAAELTAQAIRDVEDQRRFVSTVRKALADSVSRGEPLPPVRLRDRASDRPSPRKPQERELTPVRG